jgi:hypothetical protein
MRGLSRVLMVATLLATPAMAQRGPAIVLKPANAKLPEEFSMIVGARELADGRVLVSDEKEARVVVADFAKGTVAQIGRTGSGPGEYRRVSALHALTGDSTLMVQDNGGNWVIFPGTNAPISLSPDKTIGRTGLAMIGGFDSKGNALTLEQPRELVGVLGVDSLTVAILTRSVHREVAVGKVASPYGAMPGTAPSGGAVRAAGTPAAGQRSGAGLFQMDRAVLFPDGWIAFARLHPYRVDWRGPDGKAVTGPSIATSQVYNDNDKGAYLKREAEFTGKPQRELALVYNWPEFIPPFNGIAAPALAAPDGRLWILRTITAEYKNRYDIVDRRGQLAGIVTLPTSSRVVGFGPKSVYVAVASDDGIQKLHRHPMDWGAATRP